jgi:3-oxoadipate enol-lactonase
MTIHHEVVGDGPTVLLVHAGVADARMWAPQVEDLRRDHRVITVDLRGYGETPLAAGATYSDAGDLLELLAHKEPGRSPSSAPRTAGTSSCRQ